VLNREFGKMVYCTTETQENRLAIANPFVRALLQKYLTNHGSWLFGCFPSPSSSLNILHKEKKYQVRGKEGGGHSGFLAEFLGQYSKRPNIYTGGYELF
jgi:hypothetical protein